MGIDFVTLPVIAYPAERILHIVAMHAMAVSSHQRPLLQVSSVGPVAGERALPLAMMEG